MKIWARSRPSWTGLLSIGCSSAIANALAPSGATRDWPDSIWHSTTCRRTAGLLIDSKRRAKEKGPQLREKFYRPSPHRHKLLGQNCEATLIAMLRITACDSRRVGKT